MNSLTAILQGAFGQEQLWMSMYLDIKWNLGQTDCGQSCVLVTASGQHLQMLVFFAWIH